MARMPRLVVPGYPHHVTQRGNRRMQTFFGEEDYQAYLNLVAEAKADAGIQVLAYCLMPNHVHLIVVPEATASLSQFFRQVHRHYSRMINFRQHWRGHLWQERFHSFVMDETHLLAAVRYTELNPVRALLCDCPQDWKTMLSGAHYGMGWRIYQMGDEQLVYHGGWVSGFRADLAFSPVHNIGIVVMLNAESNGINELTTRVWQMALWGK